MEKNNIDSSQLSKLRRVVEETILYLIQEKKLSYYLIWRRLNTESCWTTLKLNELWIAERKSKAQKVKRNAVYGENVVTGLKTQKDFSHDKKSRRGRKLTPYSKDFKDYEVVDEETDIDIGRGLAILFGVIKLGGIDGNISTR